MNFGNSTLSKIVGVVLGVAIAIAGVYSFVAPVATFAVLGWAAGCAMVADGIGKVVLWLDLKNENVSSVWTLVGGICSILLGVVMLGSMAARVMYDVLMVYLVAGWAITVGIERIARSLTMRNAGGVSASHSLGGNWAIALFMGVLTVIFGVMCLLHPTVAMVTIGQIIGLVVFTSGVSLIIACL